MSPLAHHYQHRRLHGLCHRVEADAPRPADLPAEGAASADAAGVPVVLRDTTAEPLGWAGTRSKVS